MADSFRFSLFISKFSLQLAFTILQYCQIGTSTFDRPVGNPTDVLLLNVGPEINTLEAGRYNYVPAQILTPL